MRIATWAFIAALAVPSTALAQSDALPPTGLAQYQSGGVTSIPVGGTATSTTVVLSAYVSGTNPAANYRLRVELRPTSSAFTGVFTHEAATNVAYPGGTSTVTISGLAPGQTYHWQARTYAT